jgi:hypothetical protein
MSEDETGISEIVKDKIYLSGVYSAANVPNIMKLGIDIIVSIMHTEPFKNKKEYEGINCVFYPADDEDDQNISQYFDQFNTLVRENPNKKILVHCHCGVSRSVSLTASYLINSYNDRKLLKKYEVTRILEIIKNKRSCASPNDGFIRQLVDYRIAKLNGQSTLDKFLNIFS